MGPGLVLRVASQRSAHEGKMRARTARPQGPIKVCGDCQIYSKIFTNSPLEFLDRRFESIAFLIEPVPDRTLIDDGGKLGMDAFYERYGFIQAKAPMGAILSEIRDHHFRSAETGINRIYG